MASAAVDARARILRALAAEVGHAYRHARRALDDTDTARFLSPLVDILTDIGDTLAAYRDKPDRALQAARPSVRAARPLLAALAAPSTPPASQAPPAPATPRKRVRFSDDVDTAAVTAAPASASCVGLADPLPRPRVTRCARRTRMIRSLYKGRKEVSAVAVDVAVGPSAPLIENLNDNHRGWMRCWRRRARLVGARVGSVCGASVDAFGPSSDEAKDQMLQPVRSLEDLGAQPCDGDGSDGSASEDSGIAGSTIDDDYDLNDYVGYD
mmetsp:Transcript_25362/g.75727  ORF Transcript_25362/g.75727 Transcript_25362/m.75727 type:complete len:268 (-) Transcript_25362:235-1038(-)